MIKQISEEEILKFLKLAAPDQCQFITGPHFNHGQNLSFGFLKKGILMGCIRYCIQEIGAEQKTPRIFLRDKVLTEAKINAFAVDPQHRNQGIGKKLQRHVIEHARQNGCSQFASYSTYDKLENYAIKVALGFCIQPEIQPDDTKGCYFLMKLSS